MSQGFTPFPGDSAGSSPGGQGPNPSDSGPPPFGQPGFGQSGSGRSHYDDSGFSSGKSVSNPFQPGQAGGFGQSSTPAFGSPADTPPPTTPGGGGSGFRGASSAPVERLIPSLALGVIGILLNLWLTLGSPVATDTTFGVIALIAWVLSGVVGVSCLSLYFAENNRRRATGFYSRVDWKKGIFYATVAALLIAVVWSALDVALWAGKL